MSETNSNHNEYEIEVNNVSFRWDFDKGTCDLLGLPSALFWIRPSLMRMLFPLAEEIGFELYRLLVAHSSSKGTEDDYHSIVTMLGENFADGFLAWGKIVAVVGWGNVKLSVFDIKKKVATVSVQNPWELIE